jgi:hypothetical protein
LNGVMPASANLCAEAMVLPCPVAFGDAAETELILLSSDQDGLHVDVSPGAWVGTARLEQLFFREDELLGGDAMALARRVRPLERALACASAQGLAEACVALLPPGEATVELHASIKLSRQALLSALNISSTWQSPVLLEQWERQIIERAAAALALAPESPVAALLGGNVALRRTVMQ